METPQILVEYVRGKGNRPVGVIVATGRNEFGWALCSKADMKFGTVMDKKIALDMAIGRSLAKISLTKLPKSLDKALEKMVIRSGKYFKL